MVFYVQIKIKKVASKSQAVAVEAVDCTPTNTNKTPPLCHHRARGHLEFGTNNNVGTPPPPPFPRPGTACCKFKLYICLI